MVAIAVRSEAIAHRLEAISIRLQAIIIKGFFFLTGIAKHNQGCEKLACLDCQFYYYDANCLKGMGWRQQ